MTSWPLFQKTFILRNPRVFNFTEIVKIATMFIKTRLQKSEKNYKLRIKM